MLKRILCILLFCFSGLIWAQSAYRDYSLIAFSGRFSNPALAGVKEFGTNLLYQGSEGVSKYFRGSGNYSNTLELGQSFFKGRSGVELRYNNSKSPVTKRGHDVSLSYSHGFRLKDHVILRLGGRARLRSTIFQTAFFQTGPFLRGEERVLNFDVGVSLHAKKFYAALSGTNLTDNAFRTVEGLNYSKFGFVLMAEAGAQFELTKKANTKWNRSLQPYLRFNLFNRYYENTSLGSYINFGPAQIGLFLSTNDYVLGSIGWTTPYFRIAYTYHPLPGLSPINRYQKHELALRFILPDKRKEANFMGKVYRGF